MDNWFDDVTLADLAGTRKPAMIEPSQDDEHVSWDERQDGLSLAAHLDEAALA